MSELPLSQVEHNQVQHDGHIKYGLRRAASTIALVAMSPHYRVFQRTTVRPIISIINSTNPDEARANIARWCRRKTNESQYVQVAGAVIFASVVSCLGWDALKDAHWSASALWYISILFALASIFAAAQQNLVLPSQDTVKTFTVDQLEAFRRSLMARRYTDNRASYVVLFAWQTPIMMLGYSVATFVGGMCSVVITPLAAAPVWDGPAKIVVTFCVSIVLIAVSAGTTTSVIYGLDVGV